MVTLTVAGFAQRYLPAERGTVHLRATAEARRSSDVVPVIAELHARLSAEAERHVASDVATWWSADQLSVSTVHRYLKDSDVSEPFQVASAGVAVKFADFAALSAWVTEVGTLDGVVVDGVDWALTEARRTEVEKEVRTDAVRDAQERAAAYAAALGFATVTVAALYEAGLRPHTHPGFEGGGGGIRYARMAADSADGPMVSLRPENIEVSATITADFTAA